MKNYLLPLLGILLLASCHKDIIEEETTKIENPVILDNSFVTGQITSTAGQLLSNVEIEVYQNEEKLGSVFSDSDGTYTTASIGVNPDAPIFLRYLKEAHAIKFRKFNLSQNSTIDRDVILGPVETNGEFSTDDDINLMNSVNSSNVILYGYAKLGDGTPVSGVRCEVVWEFEELIPGFWYFEGYGKDFTDADGYFEISVPVSQVINFKANLKRSDNFINQCIIEFAPDLPLAGDGLGDTWDFIELGTFTEDTEVALKDDIVYESITTTITGVAKTCDGAPLQSGKLVADILWAGALSIGSNAIQDYDFGPNGEFEITIETCDGDQFDSLTLRVYVEDADSLFSGLAEAAFEEQVYIGGIELCRDMFDYPDELTFTYGSTTIVFPDGGDNLSSGEGTLRASFYLAEGDHRTYFNMTAEDFVLGDNDLLTMRLRKGITDSGITTIYETTIDFQALPDVVLNVSEIDGNWVTGTLSGSVTTINGVENISASFKIYDK